MGWEKKKGKYINFVFWFFIKGKYQDKGIVNHETRGSNSLTV
jgi:hypothetical protein